MSSAWDIAPSDCSVGTINRIRNIVDKIKRPENHPLPIIDLALGDPAVFGNLEPHQSTIDAVKNAITLPRSQGYTNSLGVPAAREAISKFMSRDNVDYKPSDIVIASGASQAILLCVQLLCNPGDCFLIPVPGFSLYETICGHLGVTPLEYNLKPDSQWEIDLDHVKALIDDAHKNGKRVKGILLNNPGNPTGSNYSREHLEAFHAVVSQYHLPVVADEIYAYLTFKGQTFTPYASLSQDVPVFTISGLAKQFLVPGWRIGWIAICDRANHLAKALPHLVSLTQVVLGASTAIQHAIPSILSNLPPSHFSTLCDTLEKHANIVIDGLRAIKGLDIIIPQGAMYVMVKINIDQFNNINNDATFSQMLLDEQNVMVLPGSCFKAYNMFRVVFCAPPEKCSEFITRLSTFCDKHRK